MDTIHEDSILFVDSHHGVYSWQSAMEQIKDMIETGTFQGRSCIVAIPPSYHRFQIDMKDILEGPSNPDYWEAVNEIDSNHALYVMLEEQSHSNFKTYRCFELRQSEDIWLMPME